MRSRDGSRGPGTTGGRRLGAALVAGAAAAAATVALTGATGTAGEWGALRGLVRTESAKESLGRRLFHDPAVSLDGVHSCASCHDPELGWADPRTFSDDADGPTARHSQGIADLRGPGFHWDGEFRTPRDLIGSRLGEPSPGDTGGYGGLTAPMTSATTPMALADRLSSDGWYDRSFTAAFGSPGISTARVADALASFVGSIRTDRNPLDRYLSGEKSALSEGARRGFELFRGKAGCAGCHEVKRESDGRAPLTDDSFHNTGVAFRPGHRVGNARTMDIEVAGRSVTIQLGNDRPETGRARVSGAEEDTGSFKTPSLREVGRRGPYMHDGSLRTLEEVVRYYSDGGTPNPHLDPRIRRLGLSDDEVADVVDFLASLSGGRRPALLAPRVAPKWTRVRVVDPYGDPVAGLTIDVVPAGERRGDGDLAKETSLTTSSRGEVRFEFPQWTHVRLRTATHEIADDRPLPDCMGDETLVAAPRDRIWVVLRAAGAQGRDAEWPARFDARVARVADPLNTATFDTDVLLPTASGFTKLTVRRPVETSADASEEPFTFGRARVYPNGDALYVAPRGVTRGRRVVLFRAERQPDLAAPVDLDGGWSLPAQLRSVTGQRVVGIPATR